MTHLEHLTPRRIVAALLVLALCVASAAASWALGRSTSGPVGAAPAATVATAELTPDLVSNVAYQQALVAAPSGKPKVTVIGTGGTIAGVEPDPVSRTVSVW